jgi:NhaP-type Na+/H+ or K+/H+ antiporter
MENFNRKKYISVIIVILLLIAGFALMWGPKPVEGSFNSEMFSFRRITLAPIVILSAYGWLIFLILNKGKKSN